MNKHTELSFDEAILSSQRLLDSGEHVAAFNQFSELLNNQTASSSLLHSISIALIACVAKGNLVSIKPHLFSSEVLKTLVLQADLELDTSILGRAILNHAASAGVKVKTEIGSLLAPILNDIFSECVETRPAVVLLLVLRESQIKWLTHKKLRQLHLKWFLHFSMEDLKLPYNTLFLDSIALANRRDLSGVNWNLKLNEKGAPLLSPAQICFIEQLTCAQVFSNTDDLMHFINEHNHQSGLKLDDPAVKTLIKRYKTLAAINESRSSGKPSLFSALQTCLRENRPYQGILIVGSKFIAKAPYLTFGRRRLKVAICVSGQLRGYQECLKTWRTTLLSGIDYTFFVHSWAAIGSTGAEAFRDSLPFNGKNFSSVYRTIAQRLGKVEMAKKYPALFSSLSSTVQITESQIADFYGTDFVKIEDDQAPSLSALTNQEKMHRKIELCFDLIGSQAGNFDLIVRIRPDLPINGRGFSWRSLLKTCQTKKIIFADTGYGMLFGHLGLGDQFAVGTPSTMSIFSKTWTLLPKLLETADQSQQIRFTGHTSLAQVCWAHGIHVARAPILKGKLKNATFLSDETVLKCLNIDSRYRNDKDDQLLISAVSSDYRKNRY